MNNHLEEDYQTAFERLQERGYITEYETSVGIDVNVNNPNLPEDWKHPIQVFLDMGYEGGELSHIAKTINGMSMYAIYDAKQIDYEDVMQILQTQMQNAATSEAF